MKNKNNGSTGTMQCGKTLFAGALVGGLLMFIYFSASWMLLPWHKSTIMSFKNSKAVSVSLDSNAAQSGVYMLPDMKAGASGPAAFISINKTGLGKNHMNRMMVREFFFCLIAGALLTIILKQVASGCPVFFSMTAGLLVASFNYVPDMIWFNLPFNFAMVGMADDIIAMTLAGFGISKFVLKTSGTCTMGKGACH